MSKIQKDYQQTKIKEKEMFMDMIDIMGFGYAMADYKKDKKKHLNKH